MPETNQTLKMTATNNQEPISIADAMPHGTVWLQGEPDTNRPHPTDGKCKVCGQPLDSLWRHIDHPKTTGWFAVNCCERCYAAAGGGDNFPSLDPWLDACPPEFRCDWDQRKTPDNLLRAVLRFNFALRRGLLITGPSGSGKTRAVWQLMRRLTLDGIGWHFASAIDVMDGLTPEAARSSVLVIDDLGNDPLGNNREVALLKVIRRRCEWHQPFIVTTQFKGDELAQRFSERATAQAVVRRLREYCDIIAA